MTSGSDIHEVGIRGMGDDLGYGMGIFESQVGKGLSAVCGFIDPITPGNAVPWVFLARPDPDDLRILLEKDNDGTDNRLSIESNDGTVAHIALSGERDSQQYYSFVEKLAYSIGERRGFAPGGEKDDWLEAERKIKEAELQFVR